MRRGTTPTHTFKLPVNAEQINNIRALYGQQGQCLFKLEFDRFTLDGTKAQVELTQEETLKFKNGGAAEVQLRVLTTEKNSLVSEIHISTVGRLMEDEVLPWRST